MREEIERFFAEGMLYALAAMGVVVGVAAVLMGCVIILKKDDGNG